MNGDQDTEKKEWVVNYVTEDDNSEKKDDEKENWKKQIKRKLVTFFSVQ